MNHGEMRELINPYIDGELDLVNARAIQNHLSQCDECQLLASRLRNLSGALQQSEARYRAPGRLRKNVKAAVRREGKPVAGSWWIPLAAGAFAALLLAFLILRAGQTSGDRIADELVANHVRSLLATHLVDVGSSDQHTVKPWFDGKVDFAPEVRDLAAVGFPLVGGRLDYLKSRTVVALVYDRHKHPINLFIFPAPNDNGAGPTALIRRGYNLIHWRRGGMDYWAISDLNAAELREFAEQFTH